MRRSPFPPAASGDLHRPGLEPGPLSRAHQQDLRRLIEHDPHHLVAALRYGAGIVALARLILAGCQAQRARDAMLKHADSKKAPWFIVRSDDKRSGRLNCIAHILKMIPYKKIHRSKVKLPKRSMKGAYNDQASLKGRRFADTSY